MFLPVRACFKFDYDSELTNRMAFPKEVLQIIGYF